MTGQPALRYCAWCGVPIRGDPETRACERHKADEEALREEAERSGYVPLTPYEEERANAVAEGRSIRRPN